MVKGGKQFWFSVYDSNVMLKVRWVLLVVKTLSSPKIRS